MLKYYEDFTHITGSSSERLLKILAECGSANASDWKLIPNTIITGKCVCGVDIKHVCAIQLNGTVLPIGSSCIKLFDATLYKKIMRDRRNPDAVECILCDKTVNKRTVAKQLLQGAVQHAHGECVLKLYPILTKYELEFALDRFLKDIAIHEKTCRDCNTDIRFSEPYVDRCRLCFHEHRTRPDAQRRKCASCPNMLVDQPEWKKICVSCYRR